MQGQAPPSGQTTNHKRLAHHGRPKNTASHPNHLPGLQQCIGTLLARLLTSPSSAWDRAQIHSSRNTYMQMYNMHVMWTTACIRTDTEIRCIAVKISMCLHCMCLHGESKYRAWNDINDWYRLWIQTNVYLWNYKMHGMPRYMYAYKYNHRSPTCIEHYWTLADFN